jgi:hypothetical protein
MQTLRNNSCKTKYDVDRESLLNSMIGTEEEFEEFEHAIGESFSESINREKNKRSVEDFKQYSNISVPPELTIGREEFDHACEELDQSCKVRSHNIFIQGAIGQQLTESMLDSIRHRDVDQIDVRSIVNEDTETEDSDDEVTDDIIGNNSDDSCDDTSDGSDDDADTDLCLNCKAIFWSMFYDIIFFFIQYKKDILIFTISVLLMLIFVAICLIFHWRVVNTIFGDEN